MTTTMTMSEALIAEVTREAESTRRVLQRVPEDRLAWAPHPKSASLGALALHVATIPGGVAEFLGEPVREAPTFATPEPSSVREILSALDQSIATATRKLSGWNEDDLMAEWRMVRGEDTVLALPRIDMLRSVMLNHWYHHRGQLTVYLRLLGVALPPVYGPTADENPFG